MSPKPSKRTRSTRSTTERGYGWQYQRAREVLLAGRPPCHWCGMVATTADHEPPLHTAPDPLLWRGVLLPACGPCNYGRRAGRPMPKPSARSQVW